MAQGSYVFISHCSADRAAAADLAGRLEAEQVKVWIAPRDVQPGRDYSDQLDTAVAQCAAMIVVVSEACSGSSSVRSEAGEAASAGKQVFPVRIGDVPPPGDVPGLSEAIYWTDAFGPNSHRNVGRLAEELRAIAGQSGAPTAGAAPIAAPPAPSAPAAPPPPAFAAAPPLAAPPPLASPPPAAPAPTPVATPVAAPVAAAYVPAAPGAVAVPAMPAEGSEQEQDMRAFIGPKAEYYLGTWRRMEAQNKAYAWNWAAFLLSAFWLAYRKMFTPALIAVGAFLLLQVAAMFAPPLAKIANLLTILVAAGVGWRGNTLYRAHVHQKLAEIRAGHPDPQSRAAALQTQGGVSMPAALGLLAAWCVVIAGLVYVAMLRAPGVYSSTTPGTYAPATGGSTATPSTGSVATAPSSGSATYPPPVAATGGEWVVGQWGPVNSPYCTSWMRISPDHTLSDNAGSTGTWSLTPGSGGGPDIFVMTITGQTSRSIPVTRGVDNSLVMGSGAQSITWHQEQC